MKHLFLLVMILTSFVAIAQVEKPIVKDLAYYAPQNPKQSSNFNVGHRLRNKQVASILTIDSTGRAQSQTEYDKDGRVIRSLMGASEHIYKYSPDGRQLIVNNIKFYNFDKDGNITDYGEQGEYGNIKNRTKNTYDEKGNLIKTEYFALKQVSKGKSTLQMVYDRIYKYDEKNRVIAFIGNNFEDTYKYKIIDNQLVVSISRNGEKQSERTYNKDGILTDYKFNSPGGVIFTESQQYISTYNKNGMRIKEQKISSSKNKNSLYGYIITYRDGSIEAPENGSLKFVNELKKDQVLTRATADFTTQEGLFEKGQLNGPGIVTHNGIEIKGSFKNGKLFGFGQKTFSLGGNQRITFGNYTNDLLDGYGFSIEVDNVQCITIKEAGMYAKGKLVTDLLADLKDALICNETLIIKPPVSIEDEGFCGGNCKDGFGIKQMDNAYIYTFFENGKEVGPYFIKRGNDLLQIGGKTSDYHFLEGVIDGTYCFGLFESTQGPSKIILKNNSGTGAGIMKNGDFEPKYEIVF